MKKIVLAFVAVSLLLTGCSDDGKEDSAVSIDSVSSAVEMPVTESTAAGTTQTASDTAEQPETQNVTEQNSAESKSSNAGAGTVSPAGQDISEDTTISDGELPVAGGDDKTVPENEESKPPVTTAPSSEVKTQTATTVSTAAPVFGENHQTVTTTKKSGGVIELPIIPVN
ncbi:MAG: hypothetical protein ACI4Q5_06205 [Porcipelethomonas sp.]